MLSARYFSPGRLAVNPVSSSRLRRFESSALAVQRSSFRIGCRARADSAMSSSAVIGGVSRDRDDCYVLCATALRSARQEVSIRYLAQLLRALLPRSDIRASRLLRASPVAAVILARQHP